MYYKFIFSTFLSLCSGVVMVPKPLDVLCYIFQGLDGLPGDPGEPGLPVSNKNT